MTLAHDPDEGTGGGVLAKWKGTRGGWRGSNRGVEVVEGGESLVLKTTLDVLEDMKRMGTVKT